MSAMTRLSLSVLGLPALTLFAISLPVAAVSAQSSFINQYLDAKKVNDKKKMLDAFKRYPNEAIRHFAGVADQYLVTGKSEFYDQVVELKDLWSQCWTSKVLQKVEDFRAGLDNETRRLIERLRTKQRQIWSEFNQAKDNKDKEALAEIVKKSLDLSAKWEKVGDMFAAADNYRNTTAYMNAAYGARSEDAIKKIIGALEKYTYYRQQLDWTKDREYGQNDEWLKSLKRRLETKRKKEEAAAAGEAKKKAEEGANDKYAAGSKWEKYVMKISALKKPTEGMHYYTSSDPTTWLWFNLEGEAPTELKRFKDGKITFIRLGANKFGYMIDPSKRDQAKLFKPNGTRGPVWIEYEKDGEICEYPFFFYLPSQQESVGGQTMNLAPTWSGTKKRALVYVRSASMLFAEADGHKLTFFDDNCNGVVGEDPQTGGIMDARMGVKIDKQAAHVTFDSMQVDREHRLRPFSRYVKLGDDWYRLRVSGNNETLRYRKLDPAAMKIGKVALKWSGRSKTKPDNLVISEQGLYKYATFDIAKAGSKGIEVPAGEYKIFYGRIINGKGPRSMDAVIQQGDMPTIKVEHGKTTTLEMGAPFHIEYEMTRDGRKATVDSSTFWVKGKAGEKYCLIANEILEPQLMISKKNTAKSGKVVGEWRRLGGPDEIDELGKALGNKAPLLYAIFLPINAQSGKKPTFEVSAELPPAGKGTYYIGVGQRKHKLFGSLLPIWK